MGVRGEEKPLQAAVGTREGALGRVPLRALQALQGERPGLCFQLHRTENFRPAFAIAGHSSPTLRPCFFFLEGGIRLPPPEPRIPTRSSGRAVRGGAVPLRSAAEVGCGPQRRKPPSGSDCQADAALSCSPARVRLPSTVGADGLGLPLGTAQCLLRVGGLDNHQTDRRHTSGFHVSTEARGPGQ